MFNKISNLLKKENFEYWDYREQNISSTSVSAWNNKIKNFDLNERVGKSFRILNNNGWGFVFSVEDDIKTMIEKANKIAKAMGSNEKENIVHSKAIKDEVSSEYEINNEDISLEEKKKLVLDNSKVENDKIKNNHVTYQEINKKLLFCNSDESEIRQNLKYTHIGATLTSKDGNRMENFAERLGKLQGYEICKNLPTMVETATKKAIEMLNSKVPKAGKMPVVCDGAMTDVFVHEALGHAAEADLVMQNSSCLKNLIGKKLAPDFVSIYDDATMNKEWGSFFYDDEGIEAQKTNLMKNGELVGYMHSRESAAKLNAKPTGNARAQSSEFLPQVRMSNTYIKTGDYKFEELIEDVKKGVYLKGSTGGQVDPISGNFAFSAQEGFEIINGKLAGRLRGVSLSGNTLHTLKNIKMLSNKYEPSFAGHCGKGGQLVPVYGPCPSMLVHDATIGGI